jgi:predicted dehydrogenase
MMKQIRLAVIGCGGFVRTHVRAINDHVPEFKIMALCDTAPGHVQRLRKELLPRKRVAVYSDYKKLLAEARPDAVIVSTPHTLHFRHCYDALAAGAHVLVEKPMVTSSAHARRLVAKAEKTGLDLQIAIQGTYTDTFAYARQLMTDGTLGELQLVTGILAQGWLEGTRGRWRQIPRLAGGGQLYDSMAHVLSAMMFLVNSPVREVHCWTDYKDSKVDINAVGCIRFANGGMAAITSGGNCPSWYSHLIVQGDNALLEVSPHGGNFRVNGRGMKKDITAVPKRWKVPTVTPARNFADVILGKAEPRCSGHLGILLADLMDALYASADSGKPVKVKG